MRRASITRKTAETDISVELVLDGSGRYDIATGIGFFDHMLDQLARHALIDLTVRAEGDRHIDDHHTVEDAGIAIGQALSEALGDKRGIRRYGSCLLAMDDALVQAALDLSGRPYLVWDLPLEFRENREFRHGAGARILSRIHHPWWRDAAPYPTGGVQRTSRGGGCVQGRRTCAARRSGA